MSHLFTRAPRSTGAVPRATLRLAVRVLLVAACTLPSIPLATRAASPQDYRQAVADALSILDEAADADEATQTAALTQAAQALARASPVETTGGRQVTPLNPSLRVGLADGNLSAAHANLTALLDALDAALAASAPPPDGRRQLASVLARPEFRAPEPGPLERVLGPALDPLRLAWERFWRGLAARLRGTSDGGGDLLWLVLGGLVVAGLVALMLGAFTGSVVSGARTADAHRGTRDRPPASRTRAFELAASGAYRVAVHELHLATLLALNDRGLLRFRSHLTNREHLTGDLVQPELRPALVPAIEVYDHLWYSGTAVGAEDWRRFVSLADAVEAAARPRSAPRRRSGATGEGDVP